MNFTDEVWLPISEYSRLKKISVSTIRRYIKNNTLRYKEEGGKYLIFIPQVSKVRSWQAEESLRLRLEVEQLKLENRKLKENNDELKMLVSIYEKQEILETYETR